MKNAKPIDFNRDRSDDKRAIRRVILALGAVLALGAAVFLVLLAMNDFDIEKFLGAAEAPSSEETSAEAPETAEAAAPFTDSAAVNVLLLCSEEKSVTFCDIISVSTAENSVRVKPVSPELKAEHGGVSARIAEIFYNYGAAEVAQALSEKYVPIHRYIAVNEAGFRKIVQGFGNVDVYLPNPVDFSVDAIRYQYGKGPHSLSSDALLAVMKEGYEGDNALSFQATAVAAVVKAALTERTLLQGEDAFTAFINQVDSNVTAFDYADHRARLIELMAREPEFSAIS